mmetsp:Transcript_29261/g.57459  ORF Transcript_29261/g.57459 Transcript_29261/m.57459 type:complete len:286 (-) Transcript_29261:67-924(-)
MSEQSQTEVKCEPVVAPAYATGSQGELLTASGEPRRTLYASGFPKDIRFRELRNIFQFQKGFQHCTLIAGPVPYSFVIFDTTDDAMACKNIMHGGKLDEDSNIELRLELAKTNKSPPPRNEGVAGSKRGHPPETSDTTIYFYGLKETTVEAEIKDLVSVLEGFVRHRWSPSKRAGGTPVAYADFSSHDFASKAIQALNGHPTFSVPRGICVRFGDIAASGPPYKRSAPYSSYRDQYAAPSSHSYHQSQQVPSHSYQTPYSAYGADPHYMGYRQGYPSHMGAHGHY